MADAEYMLRASSIHLGKRVRFFNAVDLVNQLEREKQLGKAGNMARQLAQTDAVILMNSAICRSRRPAARCCST